MSDSAVVVVGAGPAGLAVAAQLLERGLEPLVLEAGAAVGAAVAQWHHIRMFSPWSALVDPAAVRLLEPTGWQSPEPESYPTGSEWVGRYLAPLAQALGARVRTGATVIGVARRGRDRLVDSGRDTEPFVVHVRTAVGEERIVARAVIDASGTFGSPNPLGADGLPAIGEREVAQQISYRVPDLADPLVAARYAGKAIAVAGSGHSALTALIALADLAREHPTTRISWLLRRGPSDAVFGGGLADELPARGALGLRAQQAVGEGNVSRVTGFGTVAVHPTADGQLELESTGGTRLPPVDEVVVLTGFRPDLSWLSEVRLDLDPVLQAPRTLAPLIDPNVHSCGTVYPHGAAELAQPDAGLYLVGMKSYGRATSFLSLTGYEQGRSVAAAIAGDHEAAARVELSLPETGVCGGSGIFEESGTSSAEACCGAPDRSGSDEGDRAAATGVTAGYAGASVTC